jgi:ketohexokinase
MRSQVPPHSLLVCDWGREGGAILSMPTREYFQSSSFVPDPNEDTPDTSRISSVRSSSAAFSWSGTSPSDVDETFEYRDEERNRQWARNVDKANSSSRSGDDDEELDESAGEDTFIGGEPEDSLV